jgi:translation initiation factor IF-2
MEYGRVRALVNENGRPMDDAGPGIPVEVLGLSGVPNAGDEMSAVADERKAREIAMFRQNRAKNLKEAAQQKAKLEDMFKGMTEGDVKVVNLVLKADVQGSIEALAGSLEKLSTDEVRVKIIFSGVGGITESDVDLAISANAIMFGFNVRADAGAKRRIEQEGIDLHYHSIIYEVVDEVRNAMLGKLEPEFKEEIIGTAEVRAVFSSPKFGAIAGCMVVDGTIKRTNPIRVLRNNVVIYTGELESLRRVKDDVNEVRQGFECGIGVKNYNDVKEGDQIEVYERVLVKRTL